MLIAGIPDHCAGGTSWDDVRAGVLPVGIRIEWRYQTPRVLHGIIRPYAPEGDALPGFPATHQKKDIVLAIPGTDGFLATEGIIGTTGRYLHPTARRAVHPEVALLEAIGIEATKGIEAIIVTIPDHGLIATRPHGKIGQLLPVATAPGGCVRPEVLQEATGIRAAQQEHMLPIPHGIGCPRSWTTAGALQGRPGFCAGIKRPQVAEICIAGVYATVEQYFLVNAIPYHGGIHTRGRCSTTGVPVGHRLRRAQLYPTAG